MRRFGMMVVAAGCLAMSAPAFAAEMKKSEKDECLLTMRACAGQAKTIQEKMAAIEKEIKKGSKVYTKEELQTLSTKLKEVEDTLRVLQQR